jgi:hypothetical protein
MTMYKGNSSDSSAPLLSAKDFKKGTKLEGTITRRFETTNGICSEITLAPGKPFKLNRNGETSEQKKVAVGALKGWEMAIGAAGLEALEVGDKIIAECVGFTPTTKGNPRVDFKIAIDREDI